MGGGWGYLGSQIHREVRPGVYFSALCFATVLVLFKFPEACRSLPLRRRSSTEGNLGCSTDANSVQ